MEAWYIASRVSMADLGRALRDLRLKWVYAERMEDTVLTWRDALLEQQATLARWNHGRAFGLELELTWWRRGDSVDARAIVAQGNLPEGITWQPYPTNEWKVEEHEVLLVGERDPNVQAEKPVWSTARIPRYLAYPADGSFQRVALVEHVYRHQGIVVASRLKEVKEAAHG